MNNRTVKNSDTCKLCNHEMRLEIETKKIVDGLTLRELSEYIKDVSPDNTVSTATLSRHFDKHVNKKWELKIRYLAEKKKEVDSIEEGMTDEVSVQLKELKHLDSSIKEADLLVKSAALELKRQMSIRIPKQIKLKDDKGKETGQIFEYDKVEVSHSVVQLYKGASEELRMTVKTKMEILGIDPRTKQADAVVTLVDAIMKIDEEE